MVDKKQEAKGKTWKEESDFINEESMAGGGKAHEKDKISGITMSDQRVKNSKRKATSDSNTIIQEQCEATQSVMSQ